MTQFVKQITVQNGIITQATAAQIDSTAILPGGVLSGNIGSGQVGTNHLASGAVGSNQLASGAVVAKNIASGSITNTLVASGGLISGALGSGAVFGPVLAPTGVSSGTLGSGTVMPLVTVNLAGQVTSFTTTPMVVQDKGGQVFNAKTYGAKGNGKYSNDGGIVSGQTTLTAGARFAATDVGKLITVYGAGSGGAPLYATITGFNASTSVTLSTAAQTAVSGADYVWGSDDTAAIRSGLVAATAAAPFSAHVTMGSFVDFPAGVYMINGSLSFSGCSCSILGRGGATVFQGWNQSGAVIDFGGFLIQPNNPNGCVFSDFQIIGDGCPDPTLVRRAGIVMPSMVNNVWRNIGIANTGGCGVLMSGPRCYWNNFQDLTILQPVNAGINNVPYFYAHGAMNSNSFSRLLFYNTTNQADGLSGMIVLEGDGTNVPSNNFFHGCSVENAHTPENGCIIFCAANATIHDAWQFDDCGSSVSGATGNSFFHLAVPNVPGADFGGNTIRGYIPGNGGLTNSIAYGVRVSQSRNQIQGIKGYNGSNVLIESGVQNTAVNLWGSDSATKTTSHVAVVSSGDTTNTYLDTIRQEIQFDGYSYSSGNIVNGGGIQTSSPTVGIGYSSGAGGSITQLTSKTTAVTLNKTTGQITTNSGVLSGGLVATFVFNNSALSATDQLPISVVSGEATPGSYRAWASQIASGACNINIKNETAGALSEAILLGYSILKGSVQ